MFLPANITLQFGDTGEFVAELQRRLSLIKLFDETAINATFDSNTVNALKSFQSMQGLRVDGIAGPETLRRLNGMISGDSGTTSSSSSSAQEEEEKKRREGNLVGEMVVGAALAADTLNPALAAAPVAEEKREVLATERPVIAATPTRTDAASSLDAQTQQQNSELLKQQELVRQQPQPTAEELQARLQQQQAEMVKLQEQLKQQETAKAPATPASAEAAKSKEELSPAAEKRPLPQWLQKLVDYIESKLPRSVTEEVKAIGQTMARAGVREAPISEGPAPAVPAIEAGRGAQQQPQRGG